MGRGSQLPKAVLAVRLHCSPDGKDGTGNQRHLSVELFVGADGLIRITNCRLLLRPHESIEAYCALSSPNIFNGPCHLPKELVYDVEIGSVQGIVRPRRNLAWHVRHWRERPDLEKEEPFVEAFAAGEHHIEPKGQPKVVVEMEFVVRSSLVRNPQKAGLLNPACNNFDLMSVVPLPKMSCATWWRRRGMEELCAQAI